MSARAAEAGVLMRVEVVVRAAQRNSAIEFEDRLQRLVDFLDEP
jgi:hypothetical protein